MQHNQVVTVDQAPWKVLVNGSATFDLAFDIRYASHNCHCIQTSTSRIENSSFLVACRQPIWC